MIPFITKNRYIILLHFTVFTWGFTGILGRLIPMDSMSLVWYRLLIAVLGFVIYFTFTKFSLRCTLKDIAIYILIGGIVAIHWLFFFEAIKVSNVSVALTALATTSFFTSFIEPLLLKRKVLIYEPFLGALVLIGVYLIFWFESEYIWGIIFGVSAAFLASIFITLNAKLLKTGSNALSLSFYQLLGGFLIISCWEIANFETTRVLDIPSKENFIYLLILGLLCTAFAYWAGVVILKAVTPFTVAIIGNLEPIYSIVLAVLIFGEDEIMSFGFYVGAIVIVGAIFFDSIAKRDSKKIEK